MMNLEKGYRARFDLQLCDKEGKLVLDLECDSFACSIIEGETIITITDWEHNEFENFEQVIYPLKIAGDGCSWNFTYKMLPGEFPEEYV